MGFLSSPVWFPVLSWVPLKPTVSYDQALVPGTDQIHPAGRSEPRDNEGTVAGIPVLHQCPLDLLLVPFRDMDRFHRERV